jgi:hypothetical protein
MSKTPEELAEEYAQKEGQPWGCTKHFLSGYQASAPQWISVKDRLPEEDVDVVIGWFSKTASNKTFWTIDAAQLTNKVFSGWRVYPEATHWMPLPAAPKEEE